MAQISPKACLLVLFIIIQYSGTTKTAYGDQSTSVISTAILFGQNDPNSTRLARLADQALNSNRVPTGINGASNDLPELINPLREISPTAPLLENTPPLIDEASLENSIANRLDQSFQTIQQGLKNTNRHIQPAIKSLKNLIQQQFEETIYNFCKHQVVPQLTFLNSQLRSSLSDQFKQRKIPVIEKRAPLRLSKASRVSIDSGILNNVQLVLLPAESHDNYWQYYQDCDRWGITFSELEAANQKACEMQTASKQFTVKAIQIGYRTHIESKAVEQPAAQQNNIMVERFLRLANEFVIDSKNLSKSAMASLKRLTDSVNQFAAVLEFQAVESFSTDYRLFKSADTPKVRVANQFDILALGFGCISRAIKNSEAAEDNGSDDSNPQPLLNSPSQSIAE